MWGLYRDTCPYSPVQPVSGMPGAMFLDNEGNIKGYV